MNNIKGQDEIITPEINEFNNYSIIEGNSSYDNTIIIDVFNEEEEKFN